MRVLLHGFASSKSRWANDNDLHISTSTQWVRRGSASFRASFKQRQLLVLLAANLGRIVTMPEIVDALYGDDPNGGPDDIGRTIGVMVDALRIAGPGLGFKITNEHSRGYRLELLNDKKDAA